MSVNRKKAPEGTDNPFSQLPSLARQAGIRLQPEEKPKSKSAAPMSDRLESRQQAEDPDRVFADAMAGVARIHWRPDPAPSAMTPPQAVFGDPEGEDERLFHEAVGAI